MNETEILNLKQLSEKLNCSKAHIYKLISLGLPYHRLSDHSRRYFVWSEVLEFLQTAGLKKHVVWS